MRVCFSGINGSGKTTLAAFVRDYLEEKYLRKVKLLEASRLRDFPGMFCKVIVNSCLGYDVVCDRNFFDFFVIILSEPLYKRYFLARALLLPFFLFLRIFDAVFYLESDFETIEKRSRDIDSYGYDNYRKRMWLYSVINQAFNPVSIKTNQDISFTKASIGERLDDLINSRGSE